MRDAYLCPGIGDGGKKTALKSAMVQTYKVKDDEWAASVRVRFEDASYDLHVADARYNVDCKARFMSPRSTSAEVTTSWRCLLLACRSIVATDLVAMADNKKITDQTNHTQERKARTRERKHYIHTMYLDTIKHPDDTVNIVNGRVDISSANAHNAKQHMQAFENALPADCLDTIEKKVVTIN